MENKTVATEKKTNRRKKHTDKKTIKKYSIIARKCLGKHTKVEREALTGSIHFIIYLKYVIEKVSFILTLIDFLSRMSRFHCSLSLSLSLSFSIFFLFVASFAQFTIWGRYNRCFDGSMVQTDFDYIS